MKDYGKIYLMKVAGGYYEKIEVKKNNRDCIYIAWNVQYYLLF
ncbi:hypothetical protein HMPREF1982_00726 [Clostridiales bacterium oral taxon 876 str. F0540]|nr:hypothetical protein HMPREF1982_00726 [Clostridiales bacterium oral taxon 876 str. F0540]